MAIFSELVYPIMDKKIMGQNFELAAYSVSPVEFPCFIEPLLRTPLKNQYQPKTNSRRFETMKKLLAKSKIRSLKPMWFNTSLIPTILLLVISISCRNTNVESNRLNDIQEKPRDCQDLPSQYQSYEEAKYSISQAAFQINDVVNTSKSSWIRGASYYSCDGQSGYFHLRTDKKDYLFQGMPLEVWEGFKGADSFGEYYNAFISGRFYMYVGQR